METFEASSLLVKDKSEWDRVLTWVGGNTHWRLCSQRYVEYFDTRVCREREPMIQC